MTIYVQDRHAGERLSLVEGEDWLQADAAVGRDRLHPRFPWTFEAYRQAYHEFLVRHAAKSRDAVFDLETIRGLISGEADGCFHGRSGYHHYRVAPTGEVLIVPTTITTGASSLIQRIGVRVAGSVI